MKKYITILLLICLIFTGCSSNKIRNYKKISDIIVGLYSSPDYNTKGLNNKEKTQINNFLNNLRFKTEPINIERFINYNSTPTNNPDSQEVIVKDNTCYVDYNSLKFANNKENHATTDDTSVICKGYIIFLSKQDFLPDYEEIINNPKHNYRYLGYTQTETGYKYIYRSLHDGSGLSVSINNKKDLKEITAQYEFINNIDYETTLPTNIVNTIIYILALTGVIMAIASISKKVIENNRKID